MSLKPLDFQGLFCVLPSGCRARLNLGLDPEDYGMVYVLREIDLFYAFGLKTDPALTLALQTELDRLLKQSDQPLHALLARHMGGHFLQVAQRSKGCVTPP